MPKDPKDDRRRIAVVGAGISGLTAALRLHLLGHDVELIEADETLGGRFGVGRLGDRPVMTGGKNIGRRYHTFRWFTATLGVDAYESFGYNASRVKNGRVLTLDSERRGQTLRNIRQMGSTRDVARLAQMAVRIRADDANRFLGSRYFGRISRRHDDAPLAEFFGREMTESLIRPMVIRNNGAEPDEVYPGTFGTNLAMLLDHYDQLAGGIQPALDAMAGRVTIRAGARVEGLVTNFLGRVTGLRIATGGGSSSGSGSGETADHDYDGVVLATPAHATAGIVAGTRPRMAERLRRVRYFPSTVVLVEYDEPVFTSEVRALAMDDGPCSNAGSYGKQERHIVRYTYSGRQGRLTDPTDEVIDKLTTASEDLLAKYLGAPRATRLNTLVRHWPAAYCGYLPHHPAFLRHLREDVEDVPGLELAGDYIQGVSIEACARTGRAAAGRIAAQLTGVPA